MDELKKLFEAIAKEKTRNLELQKEEVLKEVEKSQRKKSHSKKVQEDFWGVFKGELQKLSEVEDCLLYTSPSPRDRQKSRMPSSA